MDADWPTWIEPQGDAKIRNGVSGDGKLHEADKGDCFSGGSSLSLGRRLIGLDRDKQGVGAVGETDLNGMRFGVELCCVREAAAGRVHDGCGRQGRVESALCRRVGYELPSVGKVRSGQRSEERRVGKKC